MGSLRRLLNGDNNIDFPKWWKLGIVLSVVLVVVSLGSFAVRGLNLGVEFTGGLSAEVTVPDDVTVEDARTAMVDADQGNARVQVVTTPDRRNVRVQTSDAEPGVQEAVVGALATLADVPTSEVSLTSVSPSWGADVTGQAARALVFFLIAILVYLTVRLEFRMAVSAIFATVHDLVISVGVYSLLQFEITSGTVIAFLMILGYSIYDTVVVFDKVKENEARVGVTNKMTYTDVASLSMNQVLLRSINTSITSLLPVLCILIIGAGVLGAVTLGQFGIALAVGLAVGTYSSIMVAAPALVMLKEREPRFKQLRERLAMGGADRTSTIVSGAPDDDAGSDSASRSGAGAGGGGGVSRAPTAASGARPATAIPPRPRKKTKKR